ncbi:MAG TPA: hypothetical protein VFX60_10340, partial [Micromonospora sp.]|nr:hypothetical protein [Micromonospora sp.]
TRSAVMIWVAITVGMVLHDLMYGPQAAYMAELFTPELRYTGASLGYQVASLVAGGVSPVLAVWLLSVADNRPWPVVIYVLLMSAITIYATWRGPETHRGNRVAGDETAAGGDYDGVRVDLAVGTATVPAAVVDLTGAHQAPVETAGTDR